MEVYAIISESDFSVAYERFADAIFRFCVLRLRNREQAKDITQETFVRTWKYFVEKGPIDNCRPFLYKVALRLIINESRRHKTQSLDELSETVGFDPADKSAVDNVDAHSDFLEGEKALRHIEDLSPKYREIIHLRFVDDLSITEISEITGETHNVISVRIHRALKELKKYVNTEKPS